VALTVRWEKGTGMRLTLYDVNGQQLGRTPVIAGGEANFDVRSLDTGLYLLRLEQGSRTYLVRVAIVK
jgi:hypothetical protein